MMGKVAGQRFIISYKEWVLNPGKLLMFNSFLG